MDKYIIGENSSGKTRAMLVEAQKSGAVVVCKSPIHMQSKANAYGLYGIEFIGYDGFNDGNVCAEKIAIDEIGDFIKYIFGVELDAFTMTVE